MMKVLRIFAGVVFTLMSVSAAFAGGDLKDPYAYTPPPPPAGPYCGGPFSGFYGGGILGFGGLTSKTTIPANPPFADANLKENDRGFTIGGVGGYNWQCNGRLIGIESDISYFNADAVGTLNCPSCTTGNPYLSFGSEINWYGTLRGRVGLLGYENFLVYATGGLAFGGVDHTMKGGAFNTVVFSKTDSDTQIGWTAGGGAEYLLSDHWAFRAEALYVDLGSQDQSFTTNACSGGNCTLRATYDDSFWVARVGLTYLFGGDRAAPAPDYGPLK